MTRKLKALGLAFVAVLAFGALSATAASAASFHSEDNHVHLSGSQLFAEGDVFTFNAGTVRCNSISYLGTTLAATTETITVTPVYAGCNAFGFINTPIDVNGCSYTFNAGGSLAISCPEGKAITVTAFTCDVSLSSQTVASGITYDNHGSGTSRDVTATSNVSGLKYTQEGTSKFPCTKGTFTNGTYKGSMTLSAQDTSGNRVGIWHS